jgi:hypothetical protein
MTAAGTEPKFRLSAAIMHHPARAWLIPPLLRACAPLEPVVVPDPDPTGLPRALRTSREAWSAAAPDATHHLVLQDDVRPVPGFAAYVEALVRARPDAAIALCVNWDSPHNSALVRRAALAGSAWARLSPFEWVPTLGLILPIDRARELAALLRTLTPETFWADDDEAVANYCNRYRVPVYAPIPHLLDHGTAASVVGNHEDGARHGTVELPDWTPGFGHWDPRPGLDDVLRLRASAEHPAEYVVELRAGRCRLRFVRPAATRYTSRRYGLVWQDWCAAVGVAAESVLEGFDRYVAEASALEGPVLEGLDVPVAVEVWAAGYLLGASLAQAGASPAPSPLSDAALDSWIASGLDGVVGLGSMREPESRERYRRLCAAAALHGAGAPDQGSLFEPAPPSDPAGEHAFVEVLARHEAATAVLDGQRPPRLRVEAQPCPDCGAGPSVAAAYLRGLNLWSRPEDVVEVPSDTHRGPDPGESAPDDPVLRMRACEAVPPHALLALTAAFKDGARRFQTRAVGWAPMSAGGCIDVADLARLAESESWIERLSDVSDASDVSEQTLTLPASTQQNPDTMPAAERSWPACRTACRPHFLAPHQQADGISLVEAYTAALARHTRSLLAAEAVGLASDAIPPESRRDFTR